MLRMWNLMPIAVCGLAVPCFAEEPMHRLPQPDYERSDSDPEWLAYAAQFHGHLGPWATAGTRLGMAGLREVGAKGYFDVVVVCEGPFVKPPRSCFLDGLQVATGATLGKRNLRWDETKTAQIVVRVKNTRTGEEAEVRPTPKLLELLGSFRSRVKTATGRRADDAAGRVAGEHDSRPPETGHTVETIARKIAAMPDRQILTVNRLDR